MIKNSWRSIGALAMATAICATATASHAADVAITKTSDGAKVTVDGQQFAEYHAKQGHQPVVWPIIGPGGQAMTRSFPVGPKRDDETDDHPHHRGLWFSYGSVNGEDFWTEKSVEEASAQRNQIVQRDLASESVRGQGRIVTHNDWMSDGKKVCEDERTIGFGVDDRGRWIDFAVDVTASDGPLTFGDTKEGAFGLRVPGTMAIDGKKGGHIFNSALKLDGDAWGRAAEWVDYSGPVDSKSAGITIFDLPDSYRHPARWHVRTYGLFAANPFGEQDFVATAGEKEEGKQGEATLAKGEKLRLHYRVLFHGGELMRKELDAAYKEYAEKK